MTNSLALLGALASYTDSALNGRLAPLRAELAVRPAKAEPSYWLAVARRESTLRYVGLTTVHSAKRRARA